MWLNKSFVIPLQIIDKLITAHKVECSLLTFKLRIQYIVESSKRKCITLLTLLFQFIQMLKKC